MTEGRFFCHLSKNGERTVPLSFSLSYFCLFSLYSNHLAAKADKLPLLFISAVFHYVRIH